MKRTAFAPNYNESEFKNNEGLIKKATSINNYIKEFLLFFIKEIDPLISFYNIVLDFDVLLHDLRFVWNSNLKSWYDKMD
ncbi:hypothetical protein DL897_10535 [Thermoflavimicrobium daqui]|uniref:Uncharacterized protein n=1 Tax=Thermoflavimicrobium daqui TaxID=2137476 RepID=A0A364K4C9_9BACL|nr:hypothetical protein DL897_10535 [Thermoflavimicrobium daqui]